MTTSSLPRPSSFCHTREAESSDERVASFGGHGTLEALEVTRLLERAGIPCCICGIAALIYYGAGRVKLDWEICVPTDLLAKAGDVLTSHGRAEKYAVVSPWPHPQPGSLLHTYTRLKLVGVRVHFILVPSGDIHLDCQPSNFQRSSNGLPYPKLNILIQSYLETNDRVSLNDVVDGSNVSEEWGVEHLDLDGTTDVEWAIKKNDKILAANKGTALVGLVPSQAVEKRELWESSVRKKGARRGWTQPEDLFATRFRLHGSPDPWLEERDFC